MKTLLLLLLLPLGCFAQTMEKNLFAEMKIMELFLSVNPKMMDSPELNAEADRVLNEWVYYLGKDSVDNDLFDQYAGYMIICNMWMSTDINDKSYLDVILSTGLGTLVVKNAIGDNFYNHIIGSYEVGVASYNIGVKEKGGLDIYIALFR